MQDTNFKFKCSKNEGDTKQVGIGAILRKSADCDWLKTKYLSTNRRGDKRVRERESMVMFPDTKKIRTGSPAT